MNNRQDFNRELIQLFGQEQVTALATKIRDVAVSELMPLFTKVRRAEKQDGSFVTEADVRVQGKLFTWLAQQWPDIRFLGEEMESEAQRDLLDSDSPLWCLDPLDGTTNFVAEIPYFCISLALIASGRVHVAIVYDPNRDECFVAMPGKGATLNGKRLGPHDYRTGLSGATALVDFKRLPRKLSTRLVTETPYTSQRSFGSVALDLCWIAAGRCDLYLHGRSNIWDYGAGLLVLEESGGRSCTLDGEPVFSRELLPRSIVAAAESVLYHEWCDWLDITPPAH
ncbi:MAG: inositol monophosphatase family protein [Gammaproteobacteria bacterium]|jgi:myo-inositol-1(or 4)-monophosphatase